MNLREVARLCQVSPMTVSLVLNSPDTQRVSPQTRERVLQAVRELAYRPKARTGEADAIKTMGIAAPVDRHLFAGDHYVGRVFQGLLAQPEVRQLNVLLYANTLFRSDDIHGAIRNYCDGKCDGLVVIAPHQDNQLVPILAMRGLPLVVVGTDATEQEGSPSLPIHVVDVDNVALGRDAVLHLAELGHTRMGYVAGPEFVLSTNQRRRGYQEALRALKLPVNPHWEFASHPGQRSYGEALQPLFSLPASERPSALFCWNDEAALEVIEVLQAHGISVPDDLSVVGVDDVPQAATATPPLTTFRQPFDRMGRQILQKLQNQWTCSDSDVQSPSTRALVPVTLVRRASSGPPPLM